MQFWLGFLRSFAPNPLHARLICDKTSLMDWVYLSPHADDAALSCGGLIWEQVRAGSAVEIWTICAGDVPPGQISSFAEELHQRWGTAQDAVAARRQEDIAACALLGASYRHFPIPDCIYRRSPLSGEPLYASEQSLFAPLHPHEADLVCDLSFLIGRDLPAQVQLVCPLSIGGHVDHRLTRAAAERLNRPLWFYADYPYVAQHSVDPKNYLPEGLQRVVYPLSAEAIHAWAASIAAYRSQISTFWPDLAAMEASIRKVAHSYNGLPLWKPS